MARASTGRNNNTSGHTPSPLRAVKHPRRKHTLTYNHTNPDTIQHTHANAPAHPHTFQPPELGCGLRAVSCRHFGQIVQSQLAHTRRLPLRTPRSAVVHVGDDARGVANLEVHFGGEATQRAALSVPTPARLDHDRTLTWLHLLTDNGNSDRNWKKQNQEVINKSGRNLKPTQQRLGLQITVHFHLKTRGNSAMSCPRSIAGSFHDVCEPGSNSTEDEVRQRCRTPHTTAARRTGNVVAKHLKHTHPSPQT